MVTGVGFFDGSLTYGASSFLVEPDTHETGNDISSQVIIQPATSEIIDTRTVLTTESTEPAEPYEALPTLTFLAAEDYPLEERLPWLTRDEQSKLSSTKSLQEAENIVKLGMARAEFSKDVKDIFADITLADVLHSLSLFSSHTSLQIRSSGAINLEDAIIRMQDEYQLNDLKRTCVKVLLKQLEVVRQISRTGTCTNLYMSPTLERDIGLDDVRYDDVKKDIIIFLNRLEKSKALGSRARIGMPEKAEVA